MTYDIQKIVIAETDVQNMMKKHSMAGYVIISAFRHEYSHSVNQNLSLELRKDIRASGFSFIPVWGGFVETEEYENEEVVMEQSFIVFNYKGLAMQHGTKELKEYGRQFCEKYNQQTYLFREEGENGKIHYIDSSGIIKMTFNSITPVEAANKYFASLNENKSTKGSHKTGSLIFREGVIYLAKSPKSLYEAYKRYGEIFFQI